MKKTDLLLVAYKFSLIFWKNFDRFLTIKFLTFFDRRKKVRWKIGKIHVLERDGR